MGARDFWTQQHRGAIRRTPQNSLQKLFEHKRIATRLFYLPNIKPGRWEWDSDEKNWTNPNEPMFEFFKNHLSIKQDTPNKQVATEQNVMRMVEKFTLDGHISGLSYSHPMIILLVTNLIATFTPFIPPEWSKLVKNMSMLLIRSMGLIGAIYLGLLNHKTLKEARNSKLYKVMNRFNQKHGPKSVDFAHEDFAQDHQDERTKLLQTFYALAPSSGPISFKHLKFFMKKTTLSVGTFFNKYPELSNQIPFDKIQLNSTRVRGEIKGKFKQQRQKSTEHSYFQKMDGSKKTASSNMFAALDRVFSVKLHARSYIKLNVLERFLFENLVAKLLEYYTKKHAILAMVIKSKTKASVIDTRSTEAYRKRLNHHKFTKIRRNLVMIHQQKPTCKFCSYLVQTGIGHTEESLLNWLEKIFEAAAKLKDKVTRRNVRWVLKAAISFKSDIDELIQKVTSQIEGKHLSVGLKSLLGFEKAEIKLKPASLKRQKAAKDYVFEAFKGLFSLPPVCAFFAETTERLKKLDQQYMFGKGPYGGNGSGGSKFAERNFFGSFKDCKCEATSEHTNGFSLFVI